MKRRRTLTTDVQMATFMDISFPRNCPGADYDKSWNDTFHDRNIYAVTCCYESAVLFAAREGWVVAHAPICERAECIAKKPDTCKRNSYIYKRSDSTGWSWRYPCCKRKHSVLLNSMFYNCKMTPAKLIEILWKVACRTPISLISVLVFGRQTSEIYARVAFFRDVAGWYEDKYPVQMGGDGKVVEGDGMFLIGKRKCGVGRWHSKEHVYVCLERGCRKIRRIVVKDKSAAALEEFSKYILPNTVMCVDPGTENTYFKNLQAIIDLHEIPGPIHVDPHDPNKHTQTVERSHSTVKMRLRLGRGLHRHNLQAVLDFEDFVWNRTDGSPANIFKKLGDAAMAYVSSPVCDVDRISNLAYKLPADDIEHIDGLSLSKIKTLCTASVFSKTKRFESTNSTIFRTQSSAIRRCIQGQYRAATIHDQSITWGIDENSNEDASPFDISTIMVHCTCKYFDKTTRVNGMCCSHIVGQLRRTVFLEV